MFEPTPYSGTSQSTSSQNNEPTPVIEDILEVSSWSCRGENTYMVLEGEVKNISQVPIKNLMAVGTFKTADSVFIKSDDALVEYNPLLSGQTSPFKVMSTDNPAIKKCTISFKTMFGTKLPHKELQNGK